MPIFEYRCRSCGEAFEQLVPRSDVRSPPCAHCGAKRTERLLSVFAVTKPSHAPKTGPCGSTDCACRGQRD